VTAGAPLFGLGALTGGLQVYVRSAGIVLFAAGLAWIGFRLWTERGVDYLSKSTKTDKSHRWQTRTTG
jgi:hypothetical protein